MATIPTSTPQEGLHLGGRFGKEGHNTPPAPGATLAKTITLPDGFTCVSPEDMYRLNEKSPHRREPSNPGLHNLSDLVLDRTLQLSPIEGEEHKRRALLWDLTATTVRKALAGVPAGSHINVCANR